MARTRLLAVALIALMAVGSVALWLGVPFLWIWIASQMADSTQPALGPIVLVLVAVPVTMVAIGKALGRLNRLYAEVVAAPTGTRAQHQTPWLRSMRGERDAHRPRTVLDVVMVVSVSIAVCVMAIWFLLFAEGGGLPG
jgi:hypothetical protein